MALTLHLHHPPGELRSHRRSQQQLTMAQLDLHRGLHLLEVTLRHLGDGRQRVEAIGLERTEIRLHIDARQPRQHLARLTHRRHGRHGRLLRGDAHRLRPSPLGLWCSCHGYTRHRSSPATWRSARRSGCHRSRPEMETETARETGTGTGTETATAWPAALVQYARSRLLTATATASATATATDSCSPCKRKWRRTGSGSYDAEGVR